MQPNEPAVTPASNPKLVYVLPRLRLLSGKYGQKEIRIGKAQFWPDEDATWVSVVGKPRPIWLDIFRDFPVNRGRGSGADGEPGGPAWLRPFFRCWRWLSRRICGPGDARGPEPKVARGILLISDDNDWLREHAPKAVPLLFVLALDAGRWETPAEAFHYLEYEASDTPEPLVALHTKYGPMTEDARSLQLLPPLPLRGQGPVQVRMDDPFKVELVRRFEQNPNDRIVVACRHLFRTQFADPFLAPFDQDEAAYCACLEAVFDIGTNQRDIGKELARRVTASYAGQAGLGEWIEGLYLHRCDFVHGDSEASQLSAPPHIQRAYDSFEDRRGRWTVLRSLCLDLIRREVERTMASPPPPRLYNKEADLVRAYFTADALWSAMKKPFEAPNAAVSINGLAGDDITRLCEAVAPFLEGHRWDCMVQLPSRGRVVNVMRSVAATLLNCPAATQAEQQDALAVSRAAAGNDVEAVRDWVAHHEDWREWGRFERPMAEHLKAVLLKVARYYDLGD